MAPPHPRRTLRRAALLRRACACALLLALPCALWRAAAGGSPRGRRWVVDRQRVASARAAVGAAAAAGVGGAGGAECDVLIDTELPGDVVEGGWGAGAPLVATAAECCAACVRNPACNVWVHGQAPGGGECWLKRRDAPWQDVDLLAGRSSRWASGVLAGDAPVGSSAATMSSPGGSKAHDLVIATALGEVRVRLRRKEAPLAAAFIDAVLAEVEGAGEGEGASAGLRFYRAEPVPPGWGSKELPDSWDGGRWGPPYALLQGSLRPARSAVAPAAADAGAAARPVVRRGALAWAGGGGGPDFFIALADHPEWGNGHTVFGEVIEEDLIAVIDGGVMRQPLVVNNWGSINATELATPVAFTLRAAPR